ncbi:DUF2937 family protein [Pseudoroseomonas ludipueritiae]|uniref:DUF2937 family protein n=1 Tax=Pseudoroseomonas ludipueritiae TaxID=198093 RepID=A0ABR7R3T6_9PROT|nr:DUF2937 family protein [Pseudoroseomonas ludipueritiae]MBC9176404.1 DUF2937 family protein [Pseudoroseomonas ludipueritiae]
MRRFIAGWLSDSIRFGLGLALALAALQLPALTHAYTAALLQVAEGTRRDIDQRKEIARQHYRWNEALADAAAVDALRPLEPANAEGLAASMRREELLRDSHRRLLATPELLRPLKAGWALATDMRTEAREVLRIAWATHVPQVVISTAGAIYGLAGLMLGLLLAQLLLSLLGAMWPPRPGPKPLRSPGERRRPTLPAREPMP